MVVNIEYFYRSGFLLAIKNNSYTYEVNLEHYF